MGFNDEIRKALLDRHITVKQFCEDVGISRQLFYCFSKDVHAPSPKTLRKMNNYLDIKANVETRKRGRQLGSTVAKTTKEETHEEKSD